MNREKPSDLLDYFVLLTPKFSARWGSDDNYNIEENGDFTFCGVCNEYAHYFIDQDRFKGLRKPSRFDVDWQESIDENIIIELFTFIEDILNSTNKSKSVLANSLTSCFLEDISQTAAGEYAKQFMGSKSIAFFNKWHISS